MSIEAEAPATIYEIEEVADSDNDEADGQIEVSPSLVTQDSTAPAVALR